MDGKDIRPFAGRLTLDRATMTATLDGKAYPIEDAAGFGLFEALFEANGALTPSYRIKKLPGCRGRHDRVINRHLAALRHIIRSKSGPGGGYWICLPQEDVHDDPE
jgi:hypothetical protein